LADGFYMFHFSKNKDKQRIVRSKRNFIMVNIKKQRNNRRGKLEIFFDILTAIHDEHVDNGVVRPTRVHHRLKLSYDRMLPYLDELKKLHMISKSALSITEKGSRFLADYNKIRDLQAKIEKSYLSL